MRCRAMEAADRAARDKDQQEAAKIARINAEVSEARKAQQVSQSVRQSSQCVRPTVWLVDGWIDGWMGARRMRRSVS